MRNPLEGELSIIIPENVKDKILELINYEKYQSFISLFNIASRADEVLKIMRKAFYFDDKTWRWMDKEGRKSYLIRILKSEYQSKNLNEKLTAKRIKEISKTIFNLDISDSLVKKK
jgi:hypothetical protein